MALPTLQPTPSLPGLYLSQVLARPIRDAQGGKMATIRDLVARFGSEPHPPISGLVAHQGRRDFFLEWVQVGDLSVAGARLATFKVNLRPFERRAGEVLLRRDILDKQLIDVDGRRVVRANDLRLAHDEDGYRLVGVDVSVQGLLRRLGPAALTGALESTRMIDWADVESFATDVPMVRLRTPHHGVARLHPVDIAHIVESLPFHRGQEILASLDDATAADTVEELPPEKAAEHLGALDHERAADILEEMEPDEAADVLGDLPAEHAETLLGLMEPEESEDVRTLLAYEENTAAGLMTTEYVAFPPDLVVDAAIVRLRALEEPPSAIYHVYLVTDEQSEHLVGAVALRDLILARPDTPLTHLCRPDLHALHPNDSHEQAGRVLAEYNLPEAPVIDEAGRLLGVVAIDDVIDAFYPDVGRRRRRAFGR
ncbi:MAG: magnesium transporter [Chloroflexi bacterium]|nr:magnesium transporter [Chloroflexota bacterium]